MKETSKMNKWYKHQLLMECNEVKRFLPETHLYTIDTFWNMMNRNEDIILKPVFGNGGKGIIKVSKIDHQLYKVYLQKSKNVIVRRNELESLFQERMKGKQFLVQTYIPLAKVNGNIIDFRYVAQRKKGEQEWVITGKYGKIAESGYFTTNILNGGTMVSVEEALRHSNINKLDLEKILADLEILSLAASKCYSRKFKNQHIWGYDPAVDEMGQVWLIEANAAPMVDAFEHKDFLDMHNTVQWYIAYNKRMRRPRQDS
ncbi:YheC/YheD family protein [Bacillus sp. DTU_2020_1000418_1_SI_GHA_SEK_038]|uniref:YheC/YheD family protein n=1 Tax=Bacillus sp. DTU_2020_1000418_1_SI_GHA_SEK_038 TaxID=3077585 RepID=UPI0028EBAB69|nr:YheC/YheD family protein [Bacillus sp. DTU_2020_1000418_1_SI_GHA_SEK_038]WNS75841.1 YheC/YheD family protein [Bacillus sp. DTU_2020_1000418_1_SI_GHA_SEK_038]